MNIRARAYRRLVQRFEFELHRDVYLGILKFDLGYFAFKELNQDLLRENRK